MFGNGPNNIRDNKKPNNPRPLNDHCIMTRYYVLQYGISRRFHSQFVQPNGKKAKSFFTPASDILSLI